MALKGDLNNVNLGDIFQTLAMNLQEGVLIISQDSRAKRIYFKEGRIALLASRNKRGFRLGDRLISLGRLSPEDLNMALLQHESKGTPLGEVLVSMNLVSKQDIDDTLRFQAEEEIYELFTWRDAHFEFVEGPPRERASDNREIAELFFDVGGIVMEAARRMDEWVVIRQHMSDLDEIFVRTDEGMAPLVPETEIDWISQKVLNLIDGKRSVYDISDETSYSTFDLAKIICGFLRDGRLRHATHEELESALQDLIKEKEFNRALNILTKVIHQAEDQLPYLIQAADLSHRTGRFEEASRFYVQLAQHFESENDLDQAEKHLRRAVKLDLRNTETHESLLRLLAEKGQWSEYVEQSLKAAELALKLGSYQRAREILERAAAERPDDLQVVSQLANVYVKLNRKEDAIDMLVGLLEQLDVKRERRKIEVLGERIVKLGCRDPHVMKILQGAKQDQKSTKRRRLVIAATIAPILGLGAYLYQDWVTARDTRAMFDKAVSAWEAGDAERAGALLAQVRQRDPNKSYVPEWPKLARSVDEHVQQLRATKEAALDRENSALFEMAAQHLAAKKYADAIGTYLAVAKKQCPERWRTRIRGQIAQVRKTLFEEHDRLQKRRKAVANPDGKEPDSQEIQDAYERVLADPTKDRVMTLSLRFPDFEGPRDLMTSVDELKQPVGLIIRFFEEVYQEQQIHTEVTRKEKLYAFVNREFVLATDAFKAGDLKTAKDHLGRILDSSYSQKPREDVQQLFEEVKSIQALVDRFSNPDEIDDIDGMFDQVRTILTRYPQLDRTMKLPLQIHVTPAGARVYKGDFFVGLAAPTRNITYLPNMEEVIEVRKDGFIPFRRSLKDNDEWLWRVNLRREVVRAWRTGGSLQASPRFDGRYVYVPCRNGSVYVVDPAQDVFAHQIRTGSIGGCATPVAVRGNAIYFPVLEGQLLAVETDGFRERWRIELGSGIPAAPAVGDDLVVIGLEDGRVVAVNRETGEEVWTAETGGQIRATPTIHGNFVYVASFDKRVYALRLHDGRTAWSYDAGEVVEAPIAVGTDGRVYAVDKWRYLTALDATTGEVRWRRDIGGTSCEPIVREGSVLVAAHDRMVLRLSAADGKELSRYRTAAPIAAAPTVHDGSLYVGTKDGELWVYDIGSGDVRWRFDARDAILTSPLIAGEHVVVVCANRRIHMLKR